MTHKMDYLDLQSVVPSKTNPRKNFDKKQLEELTASIKDKGVLQPVLVRPVSGNGHFEIVSGERRFRAAKAAGLDKIPAVIQELDDKTTLEIQVIENLQRTDLHPLEEAEGYEKLMKTYCKTVDEIAVKVRKSKSYIYGVLKLCDLVPDVRKMFYEDRFSESIALLLARMPADFQVKAAKDIVAQEMSFRDAKEHIEDDYMLLLKEAPFPTNDAKLCAKAGPCLTCPKRTGNQPELFPDIKSADVCTDPKCFAMKKDAYAQRCLEEAKQKGQEVMPLDRSRKIFSDYGKCSLLYDSDFVDLSEKEYRDDKNRTRAELLKKYPNFRPIIAVDSKGNVREIAKKANVEKAFRDLGYKFSGHSDQKSAEDRKQRLENKIKNEIAARGIAALLPVIEKDQKQSFWPLLAEAVLRHSHFDEIARMAQRIDPKTKRADANATVAKYLKAIGPEKLPGFIIELLISPNYGTYGSWDELFRKFCTHYKIDLHKIGNEVKKTKTPDSKNKKK